MELKLQVKTCGLARKQEEMFEHDKGGSLRYVLCLNGIVTGAAAITMARQMHRRNVWGSPATKGLVSKISKLAPGTLPSPVGPIVVLLVL